MPQEPLNGHIRMRVDLITRESCRGLDQLVGYYNVLQVPAVGEVVNLDGDPYRVVERSWGFTQEEAKGYSFVRVLKAQ